MADNNPIYLNGNDLSPEDLVRLQSASAKIVIAEDSITKINGSRKVLDDIVAGTRVVYGVNTGFGKFADKIISKDNLAKLQVNLIRSHCAGTGKPLSKERSRSLLALRINVLCKGFSGICYENVKKMVNSYNNDCIPVVPEKGTVGASGDLAPLSHIALGLMGEGPMWTLNVENPTPDGKACDVLKVAGCDPIELGAKEGLAMINGTQFITSLTAEALVRSERLLKTAIIVAAVSIEALLGTSAAFDPEIHAARPHTGQNYVAKLLRKLLPAPVRDPEVHANADAFESKLKNKYADAERVQDAYTCRCTPQVYGVTLDTLKFVRHIITTEINSATDNPMVFESKNATVSGGNFHGEYPAKMADFLSIAVAELAQMSERRIERLMNPANNDNMLPMFLTPGGGLNSGLMITHVGGF